jgi:RNA polymerase sigma-70 factor (ECF subfamily)
MVLTDQAVIERARSGDGEAFRVLVERYSRSLFRMAFRMTGRAADAEDVVQETFLKAYRQMGQFDDRASFGTWLYRIGMNCALDVVRARGRRNELAPQRDEDGSQPDPLLTAPSTDPLPDRLAWNSEFRREIVAAMKELSGTERAAFVLRHFEGMRLEEVGRVLGCHTGAAKHSVFRAVQKLRRALEPLVSKDR